MHYSIFSPNVFYEIFSFRKYFTKNKIYYLSTSPTSKQVPYEISFNSNHYILKELVSIWEMTEPKLNELSNFEKLEIRKSFVFSFLFFVESLLATFQICIANATVINVF